MKIELLKELIKGAVKEAVREEMQKILSEEVPTQGCKDTLTKYENYKPVQTITKPAKTYNNPISEIMDMTRNTMMQNSQGVKPNIASMISAPGLGMDSHLVEGHFGTPEPGIDISQFDFIGKAAAVYKASVEKDKQRFGA